MADITVTNNVDSFMQAADYAAMRTLLNVENGATADQTGAEIKTAYEAEANAYTDTKDTKLTGIETGATADQTGDEMLTAILAATAAFRAAKYAVNAQVGTTYTLVLTDSGKIVTMTNAAANVMTVPTNASVAFPVGSVISVLMGGAGTTTVTGDTGVTVNGVSAGSVAISAQYQGLSLLKVATDTWIASGSF